MQRLRLCILRALYCVTKLMKPLKQKVSITLDEDLILTLRELAENEDRSFSQYINLILKDFLKKRGENTRQKP